MQGTQARGHKRFTKQDCCKDKSSFFVLQWILSHQLNSLDSRLPFLSAITDSRLTKQLVYPLIPKLLILATVRLRYVNSEQLVIPLILIIRLLDSEKTQGGEI